MSLAERIEAAGVDEQLAMLEEAFEALFPAPDSGRSPDDGYGWAATVAKNPAFIAWCNLKQRFTAMLDAEAYESAAMMLVPEGCSWELMMSRTAIEAEAFIWDMTDLGTGNRGIAATPALALAAAAIRAGAK